MKEKEIMVTIRCITYNHKSFIRQCLDGFVMQKTNFRFIAIVHDDASTDGNADIIREYAQKYPEIIRPILQTENQHSKGFKDAQKLLLDLCSQTKYVAYCEGDDYWTDPLKLQKQFDFMEGHPDYTACFHQTILHYEDGNKDDELCGHVQDRDYSGIELYKSENRPATASIFLKTSVYKCSVYQEFLKTDMSFGDIPLFLSCAHEGMVRGMSDTMAVYRKHPQGLTNTFITGSNRMLKFADDHMKIWKIFGKQYKKECVRIYVIDYINFFFINYHQGKYFYNIILKVLIKYPITTIRFIYERLSAHNYKLTNNMIN